MNSHEVFIHIHQGCFAGTGAIVRLPQCQWSKPDRYGKISQCVTTTKHSKAKTVCIFLGIYCIYLSLHQIKPPKLNVTGDQCSEGTIKWFPCTKQQECQALVECLNTINRLKQCKQTSITNIIFNLVNEFPPIDEALSWAAVLNPALNKINIRPQGRGFHSHSY